MECEAELFGSLGIETNLNKTNKEQTMRRNKMELTKELDQWLDNYDKLLNEMRAAYIFKNKEAIDDLSKRILNTQVQIAICTKRLKEQGYAYSKTTIGSCVRANIDIGEDSPVDLGCPDGYWSE